MSFQEVTSGLLIGFSIAAPVGPIGVLCIRRTLAHGRLNGFVSGIGAATTDAVYGCIAAFGVAFISGTLIQHQFWLRTFGGLFLCLLGVRTFFSKPIDRISQEESKKGLIASYFSTFLLTLLNPMTIISFAGIFASIGLVGGYVSFGLAASLVLCVFLGSAAWWLVLSSAVSLARIKVTVRSLEWVNKISGIAILTFGVFALTILSF